MSLSVVLFWWFFIPATTYWYWENPSTIYKLPSNTTISDPTAYGEPWVNNQTWYSLLSIRPHWERDPVYLSINVANRCPDIAGEFPNREKVWSSRKVFIFAAIGFIIIKGLGLMLYIYDFLKVVCWCFNIKIRWLKIKWEIMNGFALLIMIIAIVFWLICTGVITSIGGIQLGPILDIILIFVYRILSIHAKKYMNDIERYRIMQDL